MQRNRERRSGKKSRHLTATFENRRRATLRLRNASENSRIIIVNFLLNLEALLKMIQVRVLNKYGYSSLVFVVNVMFLGNYKCDI
jgi:hypothetical protein